MKAHMPFPKARCFGNGRFIREDRTSGGSAALQERCCGEGAEKQGRAGFRNGLDEHVVDPDIHVVIGGWDTAVFKREAELEITLVLDGGDAGKVDRFALPDGPGEMGPGWAGDAEVKPIGAVDAVLHQ